MTPLISIIVPIYKVEPYLRKCVDSILAQTYTNLEVILVDDGSHDGCPAICDEYAAKDRRVAVIHQRNAGVSVARNVGMDAAKGEYIGFVDGDDWIEPDMYEVLYEVIRAAGTEMAASFLSIDDKRPEKVSADQYVVYSRNEAIRRFLHGECALLSVWGKLYTREAVKTLRFDPVLLASQDMHFESRLLVKIESVAYLKYASYHYIMRADSAVHAYNERSWTYLYGTSMTIEVIREFDVELGKCAETQAINYDVCCAKEAVALGKYPDENHGKIVAHIRKYLTLETWTPLPLKIKCWLCLLLLGRRPFLMGRSMLGMLLKLKRFITPRSG